jgi:hypothetical protein
MKGKKFTVQVCDEKNRNHLCSIEYTFDRKDFGRETSSYNRHNKTKYCYLNSLVRKKLLEANDIYFYIKRYQDETYRLDGKNYQIPSVIFVQVDEKCDKEVDSPFDHYAQYKEFLNVFL